MTCMCDHEAEQVLRAIEGKPLVGSLWRRSPRTYLDYELVGRIEAYTPGGRLLMVHHLCECDAITGKRRGKSLGPGCGYEWVCEVDYLREWQPVIAGERTDQSG